VPQIFDLVLSWTASNSMRINTSKTKEMMFVSLSTANPPLLSTSAGSVKRVSTFKLLGLNFDASLSWSVHIIIITAKASKQLKRVGVWSDPQQLLHFYATVIRHVLEYCAPVWHYAITRLQTEHLESIQKRAIHIIYPQHKRHCVRWGPSSPSPKGAQPPNFRPMSVVAKQLGGLRCHLVWSRPRPMRLCVRWEPTWDPRLIQCGLGRCLLPYELASS